MKKILIVEDDAAIRQTLQDFVEHAGHRTVLCERGDEAEAVFKSEKPDLVLLDLNLPGKDGIEVAKALRQNSPIPIIMLTARREEADQLLGLEVGADDYVVKPFSPRVLVRKIERWLERPLPEQAEVLRFKDLELFPESRTVQQITADKRPQCIDLTPVEFNLLHALLAHPTRAYSRDELIERAYDSVIPPDIFDRTIDVHIKNLRRKLGPGDYIRTVRSVGYQAGG